MGTKSSCYLMSVASLSSQTNSLARRKLGAGRFPYAHPQLPVSERIGLARQISQLWGKKSVKRMSKCTLKEFQELSEVLNTSPNVKIWSFLETAILFASLATASCGHQSHRGLHGVVAALWLSVFASAFVSVSKLFLPCSHYNFFCHFDITAIRPLAPLQCQER